MAVLLLLGCTSVPELPPEEVLARASKASGELVSAVFQLQGSFHAPEAADLEFALDGILQSSGEQLLLRGVVNGSLKENEKPHRLDADFEAFIAMQDDVYILLQSVAIDPPHPLVHPVSLGLFQGKWWHLPKRKDADALVRVSADPNLLRAQAEVVLVTQDLGSVTINRRPSYHYAVTLDKEKCLAYLEAASVDSKQPFDREQARAFIESLTATGEFFIDAETFNVQRLLWRISFGNPEQKSELNMAITFRDFNAAPVLVPPKNAEQFSPLLMLQAMETAFPDLESLVPAGQGTEYDPSLQESDDVSQPWVDMQDTEESVSPDDGSEAPNALPLDQ